jgi:hypothetical protein
MMVDRTVPPLKLLPKDLDSRISGKFKFSALTAQELDDTLWPKKIESALRAFCDLIVMADRGKFAPAALRRLGVYQVATEHLRTLMQEVIMLKLGQDVSYAFALERGFEELLKRECKKIQDQGAVSCKIRFVCPRDYVQEGPYPIYDRVTIRFDGQFELSFVDDTRYGRGLYGT